MINNTVLTLNNSIKLDGITVQMLNTTNDTLVFMLTAFTSKDIQSVCLQNQQGICSSSIVKSGSAWEFNFQIFITPESAARFANLTNDMNAVASPNSRDSYLDGKIYLYLDDNLVTALSISSDLKGVAITTPAITGTRTTRDEALQEQLMLKSILQSGSLPVDMEIIRADQISPNLGQEFFQGAILAAIIAEVSVALVLFFRYRKPKILLQMMVWSLSELLITLGIAAVIKQTIDLSAIAGLIAAIGTGTNDQIIMIDEMLVGGTEAEKSTTTLKQRISRSFFIIFSAAGTVLAAMIPMMFIGVGVMRGFAIVTTIGVLIGLFLTRPAFPIVAQKLLGKDIESFGTKKPQEVKNETKTEDVKQ